MKTVNIMKRHFFHKDYIPVEFQSEVQQAYNILMNSPYRNFQFNGVSISFDKNHVRFSQAEDFDSNTEPMVGQSVNIDLQTGEIKKSNSSSVWHGKEMWVNNDKDYQGFDVSNAEKWRQEYENAIRNALSKGAKEKTPHGESRASWLNHLIDLGIIDKYLEYNHIDDPISYIKQNSTGKFGNLLDKYLSMKHNTTEHRIYNIVHSLLTEAINETRFDDLWKDNKKVVTANNDADYPDNLNWDFQDKGTSQVDSSNTSGNGLPKTKDHLAPFKGGVTVDIGGGKGDKLTNYLKDTYDIDNIVFDPFSRPHINNKTAVVNPNNENAYKRIKSMVGKVPCVMVNNCLNVISQRADIDNVILQAAEILDPVEGVAFFKIWEGTASEKKEVKMGTRKSGLTNSGFQWYRLAQDYIPLIRKYFNKVKLLKTDQLIAASEPKETEEKGKWWFGNGDENKNRNIR